MRIIVEAHRRLRVRDGFDERHISVQSFLQDILGITGCADAQDFHGCALCFHLLAQRAKHVDGVLNRIAVGELIGLAKQLALFREKHCFS